MPINVENVLSCSCEHVRRPIRCLDRNFESRLRDQTHRELMYRALQFQKRSQLFVGTDNGDAFLRDARLRSPRA
jgi:hypothetical protein